MRYAQIIIACIILHGIFIGCYSPIASFEVIALAKEEDKPSHTTTQNKQICQDARVPFVFYKECSRNGSAWLYECQAIGLDSLQQAISLYKTNTILHNVSFFFYPKKTYIRFEVNDCTILQDIE